MSNVDANYLNISFNQNSITCPIDINMINIASPNCDNRNHLKIGVIAKQIYSKILCLQQE